MIPSVLFRLNQSSQALSILLGSSVLIIVLYILVTDNDPALIIEWASSVLGTNFILLILFLTTSSIICILNIYNVSLINQKFWFETGLQFSNLISTIALTYTLLGISLGIGELSSSKLDVETIHITISKLTEQFSMAFMTSVIGLPLSGVLRSILIISYEYCNINTNKFNQKLIK